MKRVSMLHTMAATLVIGAFGVALASDPFYTNDFEAAAGAGWSSSSLSVTPVGARQFLGTFQKHTVTLSLAGLPAHDSLTVAFDLYAPGSWDGNYAGIATGPDIWQVRTGDGLSLLKTTFSNVPYSVYWGRPLNQAFPGTYPGGDFPAGTGAAEINTLGFGPVVPGEFFGDSVYHLALTFDHSASDVSLVFDGTMLNNIGPVTGEERWGLDNVVVTPEPATLGLLVLGGLMVLRNRRARPKAARVAAILLCCSISVFYTGEVACALDWTSQTVESGYAGWHSSVSVDSSARPWISYFTYDPAMDKTYVRAARWAGLSWDIRTLEAIPGNLGHGTSLAIDGSDSAHVAYCAQPATKPLRYAAWDGTSWQTMTVDPAGGRNPALGVDSTGNARILYTDNAGSSRYAVRDGTSWKVEVAGQGGTYAFPGGALAIDTSDVTHVAGPNPGSLAYAVRDTSGWSGQDGIGAQTTRSSIAVDGHGNPHIAHVSLTDDILRYTHWTGTTWQTEIVDDNLHYQGGVSLVLDRWDRPRIGYLVIDEARVGGTYPHYAAWTGQDWDIEKIPDERAIGSYGLSMAIDDAEGIHVTYYSNPPGVPAVGLRYSYGVPEPAALTLLALGGAAILRRKSASRPKR